MTRLKSWSVSRMCFGSGGGGHVYVPETLSLAVTGLAPLTLQARSAEPTFWMGLLLAAFRTGAVLSLMYCWLEVVSLCLKVDIKMGGYSRGWYEPEQLKLRRAGREEQRVAY